MRPLSLLITAALVFGQQPGDLQQLVRDSLRYVESQDRNAGFDYHWKTERKQFDSSGKVTSHTTLTGEKITVDGVNIHRLVERDGKKLTEAERTDQEVKIRETVAKAKAPSRSGKKGNDIEWVKEVGDALDFKLAGDEPVNGRSAWVLTCSPRPGYSAKNMRAKVFEKMTGKLWIDKAERQLVRAEAETFDSVSIGLGILGKVEKGTRFQIARLRLPAGAWVMDSQSIRFGARVMLVKWLGNEIHTKHWNYTRPTE